MLRFIAFALCCAALVGLFGRPAHAQEAGFHVKPSGLAPLGAPGEMRRMVQSFGTWTLVCDENIRERQRVCNISQEIVNAAGAAVFSWSLAGTREGAPVMILRAPATGTTVRKATLAFPGGRTVGATLGSCGGSVCLGFLPVTKEIGRALRDGEPATVSLPIDGATQSITLPLRDLQAALAALDGLGAPVRPATKARQRTPVPLPGTAAAAFSGAVPR